MMGLGMIKPAIYLGIIVVILGAIWKYTDMVKEGVRAEMLEQHVGQLTEINAEWKESLEGFQDTISQLSEVQRDANSETRRLNDIFGKHDLRALAEAKPGLIETRINAGTLNAFSVLESVTRGNSTDTGEAP